MSGIRRQRRRPTRRGARPPHCPNQHCPYYAPDPRWTPRADGFYLRRSDQRRFPRFRCPHCRRRFSTRTFAPDYWLRLRKLFPLITRLATEGPGLRQTARLLGVSHSTVVRHLARAGRHCLLFHQEMVEGRPLAEPVVVDGFETFEFSQFFPFHCNLAVGAQSWFFHHFTDSPLRRKGAMTPQQKLRRDQLEARLGRPDPRAVETGVTELLDLLAFRCKGSDPPASAPTPTLVLHTDDHHAYRRAVRAVRRGNPTVPIRHRITSSTARRTTSNPLFPVNLADLLLRHGQANHRRETIAFSKRRQGALERLAIFTVWRNAIKRRREKEPGETPAMAAGLLDRPLQWAEVFVRRRFPRRHLLPGSWWSYYWRRVTTPALGSAQTSHQLRYAF